MAEALRTKVTRLPISPQEVLCRGGVCYAPQRSAQRCRHPHTGQVVQTSAGRGTHFLEPEERKAHNDCPDCKAWTWRERVGQVGLFLACIVGVWTLLLYGLPWLFTR
jgi:hypothetical protein